MTDLTEDQCREIVLPIVDKLHGFLDSDTMFKLAIDARDEVQGHATPNKCLVDFWQKAEREYNEDQSAVL